MRSHAYPGFAAFDQFRIESPLPVMLDRNTIAQKGKDNAYTQF